MKYDYKKNITYFATHFCDDVANELQAVPFTFKQPYKTSPTRSFRSEPCQGDNEGSAVG